MTTKRDQIIKATRDLVFEQGLQDIAMSEIAERAKVGMGTIYNYFPGKEDLVFSLFSEIKIQMSNFVLNGYDERQPIIRRFLFIFKQVADYGLKYPQEFRLSQQLSQVPYIQARTTENLLLTLTERLLNEAKEQLLIKDMPNIVMLFLIWGALNSLVEAHTTGVIVMDDTVIEQAVIACWDAIKR